MGFENLRLNGCLPPLLVTSCRVALCDLIQSIAASAIATDDVRTDSNIRLDDSEQERIQINILAV